jgi:hypothetical protein
VSKAGFTQSDLTPISPIYLHLVLCSGREHGPSTERHFRVANGKRGVHSHNLLYIYDCRVYVMSFHGRSVKLEAS